MGHLTMVCSGQKTAADAARLFRAHPSTIGKLLSKQRLVDNETA
jgi:hypothetical protein